MSLRPAIAAVLLGVLALTGCTSLAAQSSRAGATAEADSASSSAPGTSDADLAPTRPTSDLPIMAVADLPPEGVDTLRLIEQGGPFPFDQDGAIFQNRERILPPAPRGFYEEYTVITPGEDDRGARRIVAAADGGRFYTDDHYDSFTEVVSG